MPYKDREVQKAYRHGHYRRNAAAYKAKAKAHDARTAATVRLYLSEYLSGHHCLDCGERDPVVLEFDHRPGVKKRFNLGDAVRRNYSLKSVQAEVAKCDVRCANCHRRVTRARALITSPAG